MFYKCQVCGIVFDTGRGITKGKKPKYCNDCRTAICNARYVTVKRCSGRKYKNPPERLEAIKKKYSGGVTENILSEWIRGNK